MTDLLLKPSQAAQLFGIHRHTIVRKAQRGELPNECFVVTETGRYLFVESEIRKMAAEIINILEAKAE